jgi:methylphosphotriester-DNA--protein-cysteine methyltransferase
MLHTCSTTSRRSSPLPILTKEHTGYVFTIRTKKLLLTLDRFPPELCHEMAYITDAARWRALTIRDPDANGHFIYSVRSTNIYCRPTCPARLARRANVGFYATAFEAEAAGFRACKRCKPNTVLEDPQQRAVRKACLLIDEALSADDLKSLRLQDLAKKVNLTPRYLHKIFKDKTGFTPKEYGKRRTNEGSSPSTTPRFTTTTSASVQSWEWDTFDFNDLIDFGIESSPVLADDLAMPQWRPSAIDVGLDFDADGLLQHWNEGYDMNDLNLGIFFQSDMPVAVYQAAPASTDLRSQISVPNVSTFELDAAALLCESLRDILQV